MNEAFANGDVDFILQNVTDDIRWTAVGDFTVQGMEEFSKTLRKMVSGHDYTLEVKSIITHGREAAVHGIMKSIKGHAYAFCDIYTFGGAKNAKIKEMTSFVIKV